MSLVAVACGRGSRGVTTTALALTATWPAAAMFAECDPAGGSLAAQFGLEPVTGTLSLATTSRHGLSPDEVGAHVRRLPIGLPALVGPAKAEQAEGVARFWPAVAPVLARLGADVIADCGRLTARPPTTELLRHADLCVLVAQPTLDGLEQAKDRALALAGLLREPPQLVLVGDGPYSAAEVCGWLAEGRVEAELLGTLATDERGAMLLNGVSGRQKALARSTLLRSARALAEQLHARLAAAPRPAGHHDRPPEHRGRPAGQAAAPTADRQGQPPGHRSPPPDRQSRPPDRQSPPPDRQGQPPGHRSPPPDRPSGPPDRPSRLPDRQGGPPASASSKGHR